MRVNDQFLDRVFVVATMRATSADIVVWPATVNLAVGPSQRANRAVVVAARFAVGSHSERAWVLPVPRSGTPTDGKKDVTKAARKAAFMIQVRSGQVFPRSHTVPAWGPVHLTPRHTDHQAPSVQTYTRTSLYTSNHELGGDQSINQRSVTTCLLYTSPSPRDRQKSRMPSSA